MSPTPYDVLNLNITKNADEIKLISYSDALCRAATNNHMVMEDWLLYVKRCYDSHGWISINDYFMDNDILDQCKVGHSSCDNMTLQNASFNHNSYHILSSKPCIYICSLDSKNEDIQILIFIDAKIFTFQNPHGIIFWKRITTGVSE